MDQDSRRDPHQNQPSKELRHATLARSAAASAALAAALAFVGVPNPAAAATSSTPTQVAAAFPDNSFYIKNPAQQNKCLMPTRPSFIGPLTIQPCGDPDQLFITYDDTAGTELLALYGSIPPSPADNRAKCLVADTSNNVRTVPCSGASNRHWQQVGRTVKNRATGRCLSANSANAVYTAVCDGAINRNWTFPETVALAGSEVARAAVEARRAELASAAN